MPWSRGTRLRSPIKHVKMRDDWTCFKCGNHYKSLTYLSKQEDSRGRKLCKYCTGEMTEQKRHHHRQRCPSCQSINISIFSDHIFCWHENERVELRR